MGKETEQTFGLLKDEQAFLYLSMSILQAEGFSTPPALMSVIGPLSFLKLIKFFAGTTIKLPTANEWSLSIYTALFLYHKYVEPIPDKQFFKLYNIKIFYIQTIRAKARFWEKTMKEKGINIKSLLQMNMRK